jgi:hypothetical protein
VSFTLAVVAREVGLSIIESGRNLTVNIDFSTFEKCVEVVLRFKRICNSPDAGLYPECIRKAVHN